MVFSSITFVFFFLPVVIGLYFITPGIKAKNMLLFIASLLFYAWGNPRYIILMLISIGLNYCAGLLCVGEKKKLFLIAAIILNLALLFTFKYLGFLVKIIQAITHLPLEVKEIELPIGISFYTFQAMSYVIDVYKDNSLRQKSLLDLGLYIALFPQLVAGPIVRYSDIRLEILTRTHSLSKVESGLSRFIVGLAKKVLLANTLARVADGIYDLSFGEYGTAYAWLAAISYTFQIYYDFSGYSDMAIGLGRIFGFDFKENFDYPLASIGMREFWKRWHISLTTWFHDYLYIPLGGNRKGRARTVVNRYLVFMLTGLWHGASFNYIFWGLLNGTMLTIESSLFGRKAVKKLSLRILLFPVSFFLIVLQMVIFRTGTLACLRLYLKMFGINYSSFLPNKIPIHDFTQMLELLVTARFWVFLALAFAFSIPWWRAIKLNRSSIALRLSKYLGLVALLVISLASLSAGAYNPFIYFRF